METLLRVVRGAPLFEKQSEGREKVWCNVVWGEIRGARQQD